MKKPIEPEVLIILFQKLWGEQTPYYPFFTKISGNVCAGVYMSYVFHRYCEGEGMTVYYPDVCLDLIGLTKSQQREAIGIWKKMGFLEVQKSNSGRKSLGCRFHKPNLKKLFEVALKSDERIEEIEMLLDNGKTGK